MSELKFSCPHCDQHIQCDSKFSGRQIQCPGCSHLIVIPPSPTVVEQGNYQAQSGMTWATHVPPPQVERPKGPSVKKEEPPASPSKPKP
jgi:DNA-directed RNA polymerase subunit RPC12/RpoP